MEMAVPTLCHLPQLFSDTLLALLGENCKHFGYQRRTLTGLSSEPRPRWPNAALRAEQTLVLLIIISEPPPLAAGAAVQITILDVMQYENRYEGCGENDEYQSSERRETGLEALSAERGYVRGK